MSLSNESNSAKSQNGSDLNTTVGTILSYCYANNLIRGFEKEPRYPHPSTTYEQFSPDFTIHLNNGEIIVIDNTTTARHDRFKQKQWDANGIKAYFNSQGISIKYYVVLPDDDVIGNINSRDKEIKNYYNEKYKIATPGYYSMIDDIIQLSDLIAIIQSTSTEYDIQDAN